MTLAPGARPRVLVVGAASRDVTSMDPRGWRLGGAVTYGALALARLGFRVRALVGADREAAGAHELDLLREAGAEVAIAPLRSGPVFENIEAPGGRRQRCLASSDPVLPSAAAPGWTDPSQVLDALFLAPVASELQDEWATTLAAGSVALGWQGLLRRLEAGRDVERRPPEPTALLQAATLVGASRDDLAPGTTSASLVNLLAPGATLVLTAGDAGGLVVRRGTGTEATSRRYPAIPSDGSVDPTGAGDVFLAAMLATVLDPSLARGQDGGTRFAAAAASLSIEATGIAGVPDLDATLRRARRAPMRASRRPSDASRRGAGRPSQA
jgi:sugar/nucleoside kinase (ribokinase family)